MSEGQSINEDDKYNSHYCKLFTDNVELEIFQFLKNAFLIYFFVLMFYNINKFIFEP